MKRSGKSHVLKEMRLYLIDLGDPADSCSLDGVVARSYAVTAVEEIIKLVDISDDDPALVVSNFIKMSDKASGMAFRVAYETAVDLYDRCFL